MNSDSESVYNDIHCKRPKFKPKKHCKKGVYSKSAKCDYKTNIVTKNYEYCGSKNIGDLLENEYCYCKEKFICNKNVYKIKQEDFYNGTYIIKKPGYYVLCEDIEFNPNPQFIKDNCFDELGRYNVLDECKIIIPKIEPIEPPEPCIRNALLTNTTDEMTRLINMLGNTNNSRSTDITFLNSFEENNKRNCYLNTGDDCEWYEEHVKDEPEKPKYPVANNWMPVLDKQNPNYNPDYDKPEFSRGFFAAIIVACDHVIIDLNGKKLSQHKAHAIQQRMFSLIELNTTPFLQGDGPFDVGVSSGANHVFIVNGKLGLSAEHGIHGNNNKNIYIKNVDIENFERSGITLNGYGTIGIKNVKVLKSRSDVPVTSEYKFSKLLLPFMEATMKRLNALIKLSAINFVDNPIIDENDSNDSTQLSECCPDITGIDMQDKVWSCFVELFELIMTTMTDMCTIVNCLANVTPQIHVPLCENHLEELYKIKMYLDNLEGYADAIACFLDILKLDNDIVCDSVELEKLCVFAVCLKKIANVNVKTMNKIFDDNHVICAKDDIKNIYGNLRIYFQILHHIMTNENVCEGLTIKNVLISKNYSKEQAKTIYNYTNLKCTLFHTYNMVMDNRCEEIHPIFRNHEQLPDKDVYGICIKSDGSENVDFSPDMSNGITNNICVENTHITNLCADVREFIGLEKNITLDKSVHHKPKKLYQTGPNGETINVFHKCVKGIYNEFVGSMKVNDITFSCEIFDKEHMFDFFYDINDTESFIDGNLLSCRIDIFDITTNLREALQVEMLKPMTLEPDCEVNFCTQVVKHPLFVAQLCIKRRQFIDKIEKPEEFGKTMIENYLLEWVHPDIFSQIIEENPEFCIEDPILNEIQRAKEIPKLNLDGVCLIMNGCEGGRVLKGVVGFKFDSVSNLLFRCNSAKNFRNISRLGSEKGGKYLKGNPYQTQTGYQGTTMRGVSVSASKNIMMVDNSVKNMWSYNGLSYGVHFHMENKDVAIDGLCIDCIHAGQKYCIEKKVTADALNDFTNDCNYFIYKIPPLKVIDYIYWTKGTEDLPPDQGPKGNITGDFESSDGVLASVSLLECDDCCSDDAEICWLGTGECQERLHKLDYFQTTFNLAPECLPIEYICEQDVFVNITPDLTDVTYQYMGTVLFRINPYTKRLTLGVPSQNLIRSHEPNMTMINVPPITKTSDLTNIQGLDRMLGQTTINTDGSALVELSNMNNVTIFRHIMNTIENRFIDETNLYEFTFVNAVTGDYFKLRSEVKKENPEQNVAKRSLNDDSIILTDEQFKGIMNKDWRIFVREYSWTMETNDDTTNGNWEQLSVGFNNLTGESSNHIVRFAGDDIYSIEDPLNLRGKINRICCDIDCVGELAYTEYTANLPNHIPLASGLCIGDCTKGVDIKSIQVGKMDSVSMPVEIKLPNATYGKI